jgi:hypothetical protein
MEDDEIELVWNCLPICVQTNVLLCEKSVETFQKILILRFEMIGAPLTLGIMFFNNRPIARSSNIISCCLTLLDCSCSFSTNSLHIPLPRIENMKSGQRQ